MAVKPGSEGSLVSVSTQPAFTSWLCDKLLVWCDREWHDSSAVSMQDHWGWSAWDQSLPGWRRLGGEGEDGAPLASERSGVNCEGKWEGHLRQRNQCECRVGYSASYYSQPWAPTAQWWDAQMFLQSLPHTNSQGMPLSVDLHRPQGGRPYTSGSRELWISFQPRAKGHAPRSRCLWAHLALIGCKGCAFRLATQRRPPVPPCFWLAERSTCADITRAARLEAERPLTGRRRQAVSLWTRWCDRYLSWGAEEGPVIRRWGRGGSGVLAAALTHLGALEGCRADQARARLTGGTRPHLPRNLAQGVAVHLTCEPGPFPPLSESLSVIWGRTNGEDRPLGPWSYLVSKGRIGVRGTKMVHQPLIPSEVTMNTLLSSWLRTDTFVYN